MTVVVVLVEMIKNSHDIVMTRVKLVTYGNTHTDFKTTGPSEISPKMEMKNTYMKNKIAAYITAYCYSINAQPLSHRYIRNWDQKGECITYVHGNAWQAPFAYPLNTGKRMGA